MSVVNFTISSTNIETSDISDTAETFNPFGWIIGMIVFGFLGMILIPLMCGHSGYNFFTQKLMTKVARFLYFAFFASYLIECIAYALFRHDLILPMGTTIPCEFGYLSTVNSMYISKLLLFLIFMYRIDMAFHTSALGYPRALLLCITLTYVIIFTTLIALWDFFVKDIIVHNRYTHDDNSSVTYGICTAGIFQVEESKRIYFTMLLGLVTLFDVIFNFLLCSLFVYKLRIVINMSKQNSHSGATSTRLGSKADKDSKLKKVIRKQTILVSLACVSTIISAGVGTVLKGFSLLAPLDAVINSFCVWLMFTFSDPVWNKIIHTICCCCYCFKCKCCCNKQDLLMTLHSINARFSIRSSSLARHVHAENADNISNSAHGTYNSPEPPSNAQTLTSPKNAIEIIDFTNAKHIKVQDINKNNTVEVKSDNYVPQTCENQTQIVYSQSKESNFIKENQVSKQQSISNVDEIESVSKDEKDENDQNDLVDLGNIDSTHL